MDWVITCVVIVDRQPVKSYLALNSPVDPSTTASVLLSEALVTSPLNLTLFTLFFPGPVAVLGTVSKPLSLDAGVPVFPVIVVALDDLVIVRGVAGMANLDVFFVTPVTVAGIVDDRIGRVLGVIGDLALDGINSPGRDPTSLAIIRGEVVSTMLAVPGRPVATGSCSVIDPSELLLYCSRSCFSNGDGKGASGVVETNLEWKRSGIGVDVLFSGTGRARRRI